MSRHTILCSNHNGTVEQTYSHRPARCPLCMSTEIQHVSPSGHHVRFLVHRIGVVPVPLGAKADEGAQGAAEASNAQKASSPQSSTVLNYGISGALLRAAVDDAPAEVTREQVETLLAKTASAHPAIATIGTQPRQMSRALRNLLK